MQIGVIEIARDKGRCAMNYGNPWLILAIILIAISVYFAIQRRDTGILNWIGWAICALLMRGVGAIVVGVGLALLVSTYDNASASVCLTREVFLATLENKFNEALRARGISKSGSGSVIVELFSSPENTFTIIVIEAGGCTRMLASGVTLEYYPAAIKGQDI